VFSTFLTDFFQNSRIDTLDKYLATDGINQKL